MRIIPDIESMTRQERQVLTEHNGRRQSFNIHLYKKDKFSEDSSTFFPINEYWADLPDHEQQGIFECYEEAQELFDSITGVSGLNAELTNICTRLMSYHQIDRVKRWLEKDSVFMVPEGVDHVYKEDKDRSTTRDQTYIYDDYLGLMAKSIIYRAMIPIWSVYSKTAKTDGGKPHRELNSFFLLANSEIFDCEPTQRLLRYIRANLRPDTHTGNHTLAGICKDDMPLHLLARVCVLKLCMADLLVRGAPIEKNKYNLPALVYNSIIEPPSPQGGDHSQRVLTKEVITEGRGETNESNSSVLEFYKARSPITTGRIAEMEYSLRDPYQITLQLCPDADLSDLEVALETSKKLYTEQIQPCLITLSQWVIAPAFPPNGVFYMETDLLVRIFAITETVLRHRNFGSLALLSTAYTVKEDDGMRVTSVVGKSHMSEELFNKIAHYFPYRKEIKRKASGPGEDCYVISDIKKLSQEFARFTWRATAADSLVEKVQGSARSRRINILPSLRSDLGEMLCQAEEQFE